MAASYRVSSCASLRNWDRSVAGGYKNCSVWYGAFKQHLAKQPVNTHLFLVYGTEAIQSPLRDPQVEAYNEEMACRKTELQQ